MSRQRFAKGLEAFLSFLQPEDKVLDFAYGQGVTSRFFAQKGFQVVAFDSDPMPFLQTDPRIEMIQSTPEQTTMPYRTFQGIWVRDTLMHASPEGLARMLSQYVDWLTIGGVMYLCMLDGEGEKIIQENLPTGIQTRRIVYYQPEQLDAIFESLACPAVQAWYEQEGDRRFIHILAQRQRTSI